MIWDNIIQEINKIWRYINIIGEEKYLVTNNEHAIWKIKYELGDKPKKANQIIKYLNARMWDKFKTLEVANKTHTIAEVRKILKKNYLTNQAHLH